MSKTTWQNVLDARERTELAQAELERVYREHAPIRASIQRQRAILQRQRDMAALAFMACMAATPLFAMGLAAVAYWSAL